MTNFLTCNNNSLHVRASHFTDEYSRQISIAYQQKLPICLFSVLVVSRSFRQQHKHHAYFIGNNVLWCFWCVPGVALFPGFANMTTWFNIRKTSHTRDERTQINPFTYLQRLRLRVCCLLAASTNFGSQHQYIGLMRFVNMFYGFIVYIALSNFILNVAYLKQTGTF